MLRLPASAALAAFSILLSTGGDVRAQSAYGDNEALGLRLAAVARAHPSRVAVRSLATTRGGRELWLATVGSDRADEHPAVLIVGGVDGARMLGGELAVAFVERIASDRSDSMRQLLERTTYYVIPSANPDALAAYFARPREARATNATPYDDDRDGAIDEDGPDDLDGNGVITTMRVQRAGGRYVVDALDERVLREADASRGERGVYDVMPEGRDDDGDGRYNEDGFGGVDVNRNFPFGYRPFAPGAGQHAASEIETRAIADFCYDRQNIAVVFAFSSQSNLLHPWETRPESDGTKAIRSVREPDQEPLARLASIFGELTGQKGGPAYVKGEGSLVEWAYYHYGRAALGAPGWSMEIPKEDASKAVVADTEAGGAQRPSASAAVAAMRSASSDTLEWLERHGITSAFAPWRRVEHPDFPESVVEVGGMMPGVTGDPPASFIDSLASSHASFLVRLGGLLPRIELAEVRTEPLGDGLTRVRVTVVNNGFLPTLMSMGERSGVPIDVKAELELASGQTVAAGRRVQLLGPIAGSGGSKELTWVIAGRGDVRLVIAGPMAGRVERTVALK